MQDRSIGDIESVRHHFTKGHVCKTHKEFNCRLSVSVRQRLMIHARIKNEQISLFHIIKLAVNPIPAFAGEDEGDFDMVVAVIFFLITEFPVWTPKTKS